MSVTTKQLVSCAAFAAVAVATVVVILVVLLLANVCDAFMSLRRDEPTFVANGKYVITFIASSALLRFAASGIENADERAACDKERGSEAKGHEAIVAQATEAVACGKLLTCANKTCTTLVEKQKVTSKRNARDLQDAAAAAAARVLTSSQLARLVKKRAPRQPKSERAQKRHVQIHHEAASFGDNGQHRKRILPRRTASLSIATITREHCQIIQAQPKRRTARESLREVQLAKERRRGGGTQAHRRGFFRCQEEQCCLRLRCCATGPFIDATP